jgi:predicted CopG family antitoxin
MSKQLKIDDRVYDKLDKLRGRGETFSMAIDELLDARLKVFELISVLEGQLKFREWQREQLEKITSAQ